MFVQVSWRTARFDAHKIHAFKKSDCMNGMMLFQLDGGAKTEIFIADEDAGSEQ
jgi:hypothetical protein